MAASVIRLLVFFFFSIGSSIDGASHSLDRVLQACHACQGIFKSEKENEKGRGGRVNHGHSTWGICTNPKERQLADNEWQPSKWFVCAFRSNASVSLERIDSRKKRCRRRSQSTVQLTTRHWQISCHLSR